MILKIIDREFFVGLSSLTLLLVILCGSCLRSQTTPSLPEGFYDEQIGTDWERPLGIAFDENGQGYVWEKNGRVMILTSDGEKLSEPLIDITEEVMNWSDHGLVGLALHPSFISNGYFYLYYSLDKHYYEKYGTADYDPNFTIDHQATIARITRYTADKNNDYKTVVTGSRKILLGKDYSDGAPIVMGSHATGSLVFGQDGSLLASFGDGGSYESQDVGNAPEEESSWRQAIDDGILQPEDNVGSFKALQIENLNGSIIRIDPDTGEGLPSNPYYITDDPTAAQSKIWLTGFRNPYKIVHFPETGSHFQEDGDPGVFAIGDVGSSSYEELNIATSGSQCFGWPLYEGLGYGWRYWQSEAENPYAPISEENCDRSLYTFKELFRDVNPIKEVTYYKPCTEDEQVDNAVTFIHKPPTLVWTNMEWNPPPTTYVPEYGENDGILRKKEISEEDNALCKGVHFDGFSAIPGFLYTREEFPEEYHNKLFVGDLMGWIRVLTLDEDYNCVQVDSFAHWADKGLVSMTLNPHDGAIYWCHVYDSELHKITFGQDPKPIAQLEYDKYFGAGPLEVSFSADQSYDPDGGPIISYFWDFGDGETSTDINPVHVFTPFDNAPEGFEVRLTVEDSIGQEGTKTQLIGINNTPPQVDITSFNDGDTYPINGFTYLPLESTVIDLEHSEDELSYSWDVVLHHNKHFHPQAPITTKTGYATIDPLGCLVETYWFKIRLTVTDSDGLSGYDEKEIFPFCGEEFVNFVNLTGENHGQYNELQWETDLEDNVVSYEIQKSNGSQYLTIGVVYATNNPSVYSYRDNALSKLESFYRIKAVNTEGNYIYSNILKVATDTKFLISPNPNNGQFSIFVPATSEGTLTFELFDSNGRLVDLIKRLVTLGSTAEEVSKVDFELNADVTTGNYFYRVTIGELEHAEGITIIK